jgi:hypothetical protein
VMAKRCMLSSDLGLAWFGGLSRPAEPIRQPACCSPSGQASSYKPAH